MAETAFANLEFWLYVAADDLRAFLVNGKRTAGARVRVDSSSTSPRSRDGRNGDQASTGDVCLGDQLEGASKRGVRATAAQKSLATLDKHRTSLAALLEG